MKILKSKKICVVTGSRAEYGLLRNLILNLKAEKSFNLKLIVTGTHLSKKYGYTIKEIKKDKISNKKKIDLDIKKDSSIGIAGSISIGLKSFVKTYKKTKPELVLLLGDRFEVLTAALAATLCKVPVAHIHGGELTEGSLDDVFRHSISKMSHLHFAATQTYRKRIIQLGENPKNVYCVGGLGVDSIKKQKLLSKKKIEKILNLNFFKKNILITLHPETINYKLNKQYIKELLKSLQKLENTTLIFSMPNHDIDSSIIEKEINKFVKKKNNAYFFKSLGQKNYYSCCNIVDLMVGNSSSGILEMPSFKKFSVNIGNRQKGRIKAKSVISCSFDNYKISKAINYCLKENNQKKLKNIKNPYGSGGASKKIISILKKEKIK